MKKAIILFDLDGTLIDSTPAILASFRFACTEQGFASPQDKTIIQFIGHTLEDMFLGIGVQKEKVWDFIESYRKFYRANMEQGTKLLEHAREAIELAFSFAHLAVVTTKRADFSTKLLESFGVLHYFSVVIGIENVRNPKPSSEPILKALDSLYESKGQIPKQDCFMIGDTELDLQAAMNAGINGIGVLCGYGSEQSLQRFCMPIHHNTYLAVQALKSHLKA